MDKNTRSALVAAGWTHIELNGKRVGEIVRMIQSGNATEKQGNKLIDALNEETRLLKAWIYVNAK